MHVALPEEVRALGNPNLHYTWGLAGVWGFAEDPGPHHNRYTDYLGRCRSRSKLLRVVRYLLAEKEEKA